MTENTNIIPIDSLLPNKLHIFPLTGRPIFPDTFTPISVDNPDDIKSIEQAHNDTGFIGLCLLKTEPKDTALSSDLYKIGCAGKIIKKINLPDGGITILVATRKRIRIRKTIKKANPIIAVVDYLDDEFNDSIEVKALNRALVAGIREISENNPFFSMEMRLKIENTSDPGENADSIAGILDISKEDQQEILETLNVRSRLEKVFFHLEREKELLQVQKTVQENLSSQIDKNQKEYILREELKSIKQELGLSAEPKETDEEKFQKLIDSFNFTGEVKEMVDSEFKNFQMTEPYSPEYTIIRNYLETILHLPWNSEEAKEYDLEKSSEILHADHFGLENIKTRIIEYLAVRKLKKDSKGSIILLVGPPGVGKTSVGMSIARAMNKPFFRFSVGGMRDEAEIKGHRRTYIGSMPGKIIQGLKIVKTNSPVFMIDEIDKMGHDYQGDPSSALLEVLDPEQNTSFRDHYLDVPFDLSNIVFILTANTFDPIPAPLLDRAEIIKLSGYIDTEKVEIAKKYLIPKSLKKHGLKKTQAIYTSNSILHIVSCYAREAGVRNLEKSLDKIHRKIAAEIVSGKRDEKEKGIIDKEIIEKMLGKPVFRKDDIKKASIPGTAIGLAWTSMGGDTLLIEALALKGKPSFKLTGQAGDVMKESSVIALSWVRKFITENNIRKEDWFEMHAIHLHLPEGAVPKDGPSAGITMTTALISLITRKTIKPKLAMTGELSLLGHVLPIGGLKEKTVAARRNGIKEIIIPKANLRDLDEIPEHVKEGLLFHPVTEMIEVIDIAFGGKLNLKGRQKRNSSQQQ